MADFNLPRISPIAPQAINAAKEIAREELAVQIESEADMQNWMDNANIMIMRNFKTLEEQKKNEPLKKKEGPSEVQETKIEEIEEITETADRFQRQNNELQGKTLLILRGRISPQDTPEEALKKILDVYPDHALADEALDFLIETARPETKEILGKAKEQLNRDFEREIKAGRNIGAQAREFSAAGLGSPTSLRDLYRDLTGQPREPLKLFEELTQRFSYNQMKSAITFLLHSLGSDLKAKGPSIPRGELKLLLDEIRSLQGILGVFRFFQSRMALIARQFLSYELLLPPRLNFEALAKQFIRLLAERYVNPEKILQTAKGLGIDEETAAQIIIFTQMRDAIKQVAPRYYRTPQHKEELTKAMYDALETLEDRLDEEQEDGKGK